VINVSALERGRRARICVVGSANADMFLGCRTLPTAGQTILATSQRWEAGGKGANQAVAAARLGADVAFVGCVGDDALGVLVHDALDRSRIDTRGLRRSEMAHTGVAAVLVDAQGQNLIVVQPGANGDLSEADVANAAETIASADLVLCQLETSLSVVDAVLSEARGSGARVWLNPAPAQALPPEWLSRLNLIVPNRGELECLTGSDLRSITAVTRAAETLHRQGTSSIVVTLGEEGSLIVDGSGTRRHAAVEVRAVDTTGAGDCFIGALAFAVASGKTLDAAVELAHVCAALKVTATGAQVSMPTAQEVLAFARAHGRDIELD